MKLIVPYLRITALPTGTTFQINYTEARERERERVRERELDRKCTESDRIERDNSERES